MRECPDNRVTERTPVAGRIGVGKKTCVFLALTLGALGSLPLVILTPPFQAPDEVQHFYRAYQLSEFHLRAEIQNGKAGGILPVSLSQLVKVSVYTKDGVLYPAIPAPIAKTLQLRSIPLDPSTRQFVAFPGSAFYPPLPYLPQALGIAVGRGMGAGPLELLYLGRLFNCLAALGLLGLAVYFMPFAEELVILAGLLPMSLYLYASFSPDAAVIGCALVFSALAIAAGARAKWGTRELWVAIAVAAVFCPVKPVYVPMLLMACVPSVFRRGEAARMFRSHAILLGTVLGVTAGWALFAKSSMTNPLSGAQPSLQLSFVLHHPVFFVRVLAHTLGFIRTLHLYIQGVGVFGWLTVLLSPRVVYLLPLISFVIVLSRGNYGAFERSTRRALWRLALALACTVLIVAIVYLMWAQVGQDHAEGVQGRYFIPILTLAGIGLLELAPSRRTSAPRWQGLLSLAVISVVEIAAMDSTIIRAFHVF
jgi:uncharacterized membrane protein